MTDGSATTGVSIYGVYLVFLLVGFLWGFACGSKEKAKAKRSDTGLYQRLTEDCPVRGHEWGYSGAEFHCLRCKLRIPLDTPE